MVHRKGKEKAGTGKALEGLVAVGFGIMLGVALTLGYQGLRNGSEPSSEASVPEGRPISVLLSEASTAFGRKDFQRAGKLYEAVLRQDPGHYDANRMLATILARNTNPAQVEKALGLMRKALESKRDYVDLVFCGELFWKNNLFVESEAVLRECLTQKPGDFYALEQLGYVLRAQKRDAEALEAYRSALKARPDSTSVKDAIVSLGENP